MAAKAKWKGKSYGEEGYEHLSGVPARDLTDDEYAALDTDTKAVVRGSSLYDVRSDAPSRSEDSPARTTTRAASEEAKS